MTDENTVHLDKNTEKLAKNVNDLDVVRLGLVSRIENENQYIMRNLKKLTGVLRDLTEYKANTSIVGKRNVDGQIERATRYVDAFAQRHFRNEEQLRTISGN